MTADIADETLIRTTPCPTCALCAANGEYLHTAQQDRLFAAEGFWNFRKCSNRDCGLIWLDPMPLKEDIAKAYAHYYTHESREQSSPIGVLKRIYRLMKRGYWADKYNYSLDQASVWIRRFGQLMYLFPIRRNEVDAEARFLKAVRHGRLLDVGCGSGDWLATMRELGWQVDGVDFDENAVRAATSKGLAVRLGALEEQNFRDATFDAVVLNHVIEHVPDPIGTLTECARVLKRGGQLVLFTPNSCSLSHRLFQQDWRGLEPPRHLHLFSPQTIATLFRRVGFRNISVRPQIAWSVIYESLLLRRGRHGPFRLMTRDRSADLLARIFNILELCLCTWNPSAVDCIGATAVKE